MPASLSLSVFTPTLLFFGLDLALQSAFEVSITYRCLSFVLYFIAIPILCYSVVMEDRQGWHEALKQDPRDLKKERPHLRDDEAAERPVKNPKRNFIISFAFNGAVLRLLGHFELRDGVKWVIYLAQRMLYGIFTEGFRIHRSFTKNEAERNSRDVPKEEVPPEVRDWLVKHRWILTRREEALRELEDEDDRDERWSKSGDLCESAIPTSRVPHALSFM